MKVKLLLFVWRFLTVKPLIKSVHNKHLFYGQLSLHLGKFPIELKHWTEGIERQIIQSKRKCAIKWVSFSSNFGFQFNTIFTNVKQLI